MTNYKPGTWVRLHGGQADGQLVHIPPGRTAITITTSAEHTDLLSTIKLTVEQYGSNSLGEWHALKAGDKRLLL